MTPEHWQRLKRIFELAMEREPAERLLFVDEECAGDDALRAELLNLIQHEAQAGSFLEATAAMVEPEAAFADEAVVLGRFRIVRFAGRGGMGEVYEALDLELNERVALKTIRSEIARDPSMLARFKQEIQLARKVTHPHVCRIHDLFSAPGPRPVAFLTMEFLPGETLSHKIHHDGALPEAEARVIALQLCSALEAAHRAGILHRDFKSANVMVAGGEDGSPRAVVTDFGLARSIESGPGHGRGLTQAGALLGTPAYMAPEQLEGGPVGPATDIYALGVVLYEMITGRLPFAGDSPMAAAVQRLRHPPDPPRKLKPGINASWDRVIEHCLEFDAARRPSSAADVAGMLRGEPASSSRFRWRWIAVAAAAIACAVLAIILAWQLKFSQKLPVEKHLAVIPFRNIAGDPDSEVFCEGIAETLSSKLSQLERFQKSFWVVPPSEVRSIKSLEDAYRMLGITLVVGGSVTRIGQNVHLTVNLNDARSRKQLSSRDIDTSMAELASLQDRVWGRVADMLDLQIDPEVKRALAQGGTRVAGAFEFYEQGTGYAQRFGIENVDHAIELFRKALEKDPVYALAFAGLGDAYSKKFELTRDPDLITLARANGERAIQLDDKLAAAQLTLAQIYNRTGRKEEAVQRLKRVLEIDPASAEARRWLGRTYDDLGRSEPAEAELKEAISLRPGYWSYYIDLGVFYFRHGKYDKAEPLFREAIDLAPDNAVAYENLGAAYLQMGRYQETIAILSKSLGLRETGIALSNLAAAYMLQGRFGEAVPLLEKAAAKIPRNHYIRRNLGDAYKWSSPPDEAKASAAYQEAVKLAEAELKVNPNDAGTLATLALYRAKIGDFGRALDQIAQSLRIRSDGPVLFKAALVYELTGRRKQALDAIRSAYTAGYSLEQITKEPELEGLRGDRRFRSWLNEQGGKKG